MTPVVVTARRSFAESVPTAAGVTPTPAGVVANMVERARRDIRLKALLDLWLYVHVPLSFALLAALTAHVIAVFYYWG